MRYQNRLGPWRWFLGAAESFDDRRKVGALDGRHQSMPWSAVSAGKTPAAIVGRCPVGVGIPPLKRPVPADVIVDFILWARFYSTEIG